LRDIPKFIIESDESAATIFLKGLDAALHGQAGAVGKSIVVLGTEFFWRLFPRAEADLLKAKFDATPIAFAPKKEKKMVMGSDGVQHVQTVEISPPEPKKLRIDDKDKKPRKFGHFSVGCMRFDNAQARGVLTLLGDRGSSFSSEHEACNCAKTYPPLGPCWVSRVTMPSRWMFALQLNIPANWHSSELPSSTMSPLGGC
jgi:hypothetical protein